MRTLLRRELARRIFVPFRRMIAGKQPPHWLRYRNNWNSVCLAGVTGAALALLEAPEERAFFERAAMEQSWTFLNIYNDVGSYVVLVGQRTVLLDPGQEIRSGRTFSARRYESNLLNSFGHPVPRVADSLQQTGAQARAVTLKAEFVEAQEVYAMDLRSAYPVPALQTLERTFVYDRTGAGSLTVVDEALAASPLGFETALITLGSWRQTGPQTLRVEEGGEAVLVKIDTGGARFQLKGETIEAPRGPLAAMTRIAIRLEQPATRSRIQVRIAPAAPVPSESLKP